jgi:hypothetical protein
MMLTALVISMALVGQHPAAHPSAGHPAAHPSGHVGGAHAGAVGAHTGGHAAAAMQHQVMQDIVQHEAHMQQQRQLQHQQHVAMVNRDLPNVEAYFKQQRFDRKYWDDLRHHHQRLGVDTFWRLARKHREIEKLLAALREEKTQLRFDSTEGRLARLKASHETWDLLAESRFFAFLKERKFDHAYWESIRLYYERLGADKFWLIAREHREFEPFRLALSTELRRKLLAGLDDETGPGPIPGARPGSPSLIEISPVEYKRGKTTGDPSAPLGDD